MQYDFIAIPDIDLANFGPTFSFGMTWQRVSANSSHTPP
jgi:hypothetical protein